VRAGIVFDCLDVDAKHEAAHAWWGKHGHEIPTTRTHRTRSGGLHVLFRPVATMQCSAGKLAPGVDTRGAGGYVIWWPAAGCPVLADAPLAAWPEWLLTEFAPKPQPIKQTTSGPLQLRGDSWLRGLARTVASAAEGQRNSTLFWAACRARDAIDSGKGDEDFVVDVLLEAARHAGPAAARGTEYYPKRDAGTAMTAAMSIEQIKAAADRAEALARGKTAAEEFVDAALSEAEINAEIVKLAALPIGVYESSRGAAAKRLCMRASVIDRLVSAKRKKENKKEIELLDSHWAVKPWPEPVDGDALLKDVIARARRHVVYGDALITALWLMFAWVHADIAVHSPILLVTSAEPECGKTTLLSLISYLAPRAISSVDISRAALYRAIQLWNPSFVIDEFDDVLSNSSKDEGKAELRSVINSGHTRDQGVVRCITDEHKPERFSTFCPKCIGMIGRKLPPATLSRCIIIELRRRTKDENVEEFAFQDDSELGDLRSRLCRWAKDNIDELRGNNVILPEQFYNRRADNWRLLFAIADLCSGAEDWGEKVRLTAAKLIGAQESATVGVYLLIDIKRIFDEDRCDAMLSATLVERLKADQEGLWASWNKGKGLTQKSLADLLGGRRSRSGFGIYSGDVHLPGDIHGKGYKRSQFEEAWARYLDNDSVKGAI
jgi:putative DNA primase/helicase